MLSQFPPIRRGASELSDQFACGYTVVESDPPTALFAVQFNDAVAMVGGVFADRSQCTALQSHPEMTMGEHLTTVSSKIDRLTAEAEQGKVLVAQQAVARAFTKHLREVMESYQVVIAAHEFLYQVWRETQQAMLKIWQQMVKTYDEVVVDEPMSDTQRRERADLEKKCRGYLKEFASVL